MTEQKDDNNGCAVIIIVTILVGILSVIIYMVNGTIPILDVLGVVLTLFKWIIGWQDY